MFSEEDTKIPDNNVDGVIKDKIVEVNIFTDHGLSKIKCGANAKVFSKPLPNNNRTPWELSNRDPHTRSNLDTVDEVSGTEQPPAQNPEIHETSGMATQIPAPKSGANTQQIRVPTIRSLPSSAGSSFEVLPQTESTDNADVMHLINDLEVKLPSHIRDELSPLLNQVHDAVISRAPHKDMTDRLQTLQDRLVALIGMSHDQARTYTTAIKEQMAELSQMPATLTCLQRWATNISQSTAILPAMKQQADDVHEIVEHIKNHSATPQSVKLMQTQAAALSRQADANTTVLQKIQRAVQQPSNTGTVPVLAVIEHQTTMLEQLQQTVGVSTINDSAQAVHAITQSINNLTEAGERMHDLVQGAHQTLTDIKAGIQQPKNVAAAASEPVDVTAIASDILQRQRKKVAHFGDHTVKAEMAGDTIIADKKPDTLAYGVGDYFQKWIRNRVNTNWVTVDGQGEVVVSSAIASLDVNNRPHPWVTVNKVSYEMMGNAVVENRNVYWSSPVRQGALEESDLAEFMRGNNIDDVLHGLLHPTDVWFVRNIAFMLNKNNITWDNTAMYSKLLSRRLTHMHFLAANQHPIMVPYAGVDILWIDLTAPQAPWEQVVNGITDGRITFVETDDWVFNDNAYQFLHYLSSSGLTYEGDTQHAQSPSSRYTAWPTIKLMVLALRAQPAAPAPVELSPNVLWLMILKMSTTRGEEDQLLRAISVSALINGGDYAVNNNAALVRRAYNFMYGYDALCMPAPFDYNFMLRLLKIKRARDGAALSTCTEWAAMSNLHQLSSCASLLTLLQCSITTVCQSLNLTRRYAVLWAGGLAMASPAQHQLFNQINAYEVGASIMDGNDTDNTMLYIAKQVMRDIYDVQLPGSMFHRTYWLGPYGNIKSANNLSALQVYSDFSGHADHPLRHDSILASLNMAVQYAAEWGIGSIKSSFDLSREMREHGPANLRGWYSHVGSNQYAERVTSGNPYKYVPYGMFALQALSNALEAPDAAHFIEPQPYCATWFAGLSHVDWDGFVDLVGWAPQQSVMVPMLYEPCSLMTFWWQTGQVIAPTLTYDHNVMNNEIRKYTRSPVNDGVGIVRRDVDITSIIGGISSIPAFRRRKAGAATVTVNPSQPPP